MLSDLFADVDGEEDLEEDVADQRLLEAERFDL